MKNNRLGPYEMNTIVTGDARELSEAIPDESVDLTEVQLCTIMSLSYSMRLEMKKNRRGLKKHLDCQARIHPLRKEIERLYVNGDLSQRDCGEVFGVSQAMFGRWLKMLGLPAKSRARSGSQNGRYIDGRCIDGVDARPYLKLVVRKKCSVCGATDRALVIHHKDEDRLNNELENLQVMCRSCHMSHHKTLYWQRVKAARDG